MRFFYCLLLAFCCATASEPLQINLICYRNGVGLDRDIDLLTNELTALGHQVSFVDSHNKTPLPKTDINLFLDVVEEYFFPFAQKNYLIPNPEWCFLSREQIAQFDLILCKTKEAQKIFKPMNSKTVYLGFTGQDRLDPASPKNFKQPIHVAGASIQKGTKTVVSTWLNNPQFPPLLLLRHKAHFFFPESSGIVEISDYLPDDDLKKLQNQCGLHLCPSETEGFGHYMIEAMSCGNVVVTTDAPPMNEFISDRRCLVKTTHQTPWRWGICHYVDPNDFDLVVTRLLALTNEELAEIGKRNRQFYLDNESQFKERLAKIFSADFVPQEEQWEMTDYIWGLGMAAQSDIGIAKNPKKHFENYLSSKLTKEAFKEAKDGDVVWMRCKDVPFFYREILPELKAKIILIISDGDESFPSAIAQQVDIEDLLAHEKIDHIFAQNCDYRGFSNKVRPFPIGIDFHTVAYRLPYWGEAGSPKEQETVLNRILKESKPTYARKPRIYVNFQLADSIRDGDCKRYLELGEDRTTIFKRLLKTGLIDFGGQMKRSDLWKKKSEYAFSVSPHGNGLDCHRTWEDLALGCIVIVKTSTLDKLYEGLPVVIVNDWDEVTEENLKKWLEQYGDAKTNPKYRERLTNSYWLAKISKNKK